jgi:hypothetical protein
MEVRNVRVRAFIVVVSLIGAIPAGAQQREPDQAVADRQQKTQKNELQLFEMVLRHAVDKGGQELASWTREINAPVMLEPVRPPIISSVPIPDGGVVFDIQLPGLLGTDLLQLFLLTRRPIQGASAQAGNVAVPVSGKPAVGANSTSEIRPDKMNVPATPNPVTSMGPDARYSAYVRSALIDAILDNPGVVTLKDNETLTVAAKGIDIINTNPLYDSTSRSLILYMKGSDLNLLRQQKITRDEALNRMIEKRF